MYTEDKLLPVKITDEQRVEMEKRNAAIDIDIIVANESLEAAKGIFKEKTEGIKKEKVNNLQTLRQGYEMKVVSCTEYANEDKATMEYFDADSVLIHERAMTIEERRQYRINFNRRPEEA